MEGFFYQISGNISARWSVFVSKILSEVWLILNSHCIIIVIDCYFIIFLNFRYTLLHVLEFDSTRKRMSVIVKSPQGFDIIWYRSNFFRRNNPLGMLEKKFLEQRLWYFTGFFPCSSNIRYQVTLSTSKLSLPQCFSSSTIGAPIDPFEKRWVSAISVLKKRPTFLTPKLRPFPFNMPCSSQICIAKCLYSYIEDLPETLVKTTAQEWKMSTSDILFHVACF